jgi:hypothetical protein
MYQYVSNPHVERPKRKPSLTVELLKTSSIGDLPKLSRSRQCSSHSHERFTMWMGQKTRLESLSDMSNYEFDKGTRRKSRHSLSPISGTHASFSGTHGCTTFSHRSTGERAQSTDHHGLLSPSSGSWQGGGGRRPLHRSTEPMWPRSGPLRLQRNERQKIWRYLRSIAATQWFSPKKPPIDFRRHNLRIT